MNRSLRVTYAVSMTGGDGIAAITSRQLVTRGRTGESTISLSMFAGDHTNRLELAEHAKKVLTIATGYDVAILNVETIR